MKLLKVAIEEGGFHSLAEFGRANNVTRAWVASLVRKRCKVNDENRIVHPSGFVGEVYSFDKVEPESYQDAALSKLGWKGRARDLVRVTGVDSRVLFGFIDNNKTEKLKLVVDAGLWRTRKL